MEGRKRVKRLCLGLQKPEKEEASSQKNSYDFGFFLERKRGVRRWNCMGIQLGSGIKNLANHGLFF